MRSWLKALSPQYPLTFSDNIEFIFSEKKQIDKNDLLVIDAELINDKHQLRLICQYINKIIVVGENFTSTQQIEFIYQGAWGYSDKFIDERLILRTIESVINNEIWLKRQLIPQMLKVIAAKQKLSVNKENADPEVFKKISILTPREIEVVEYMYNGKDNIFIAEQLNISIRTVKAHLSSIFKKLHVLNRFQLVVFLKDLNMGDLITSENLPKD